MQAIKFKDFYTLTFVDVGYYNPGDSVLGAVYCPGLVCMKTSRPTCLGVVVQEADGKVLLSLNGEGVPDNSAWEYEISDQRFYRNHAEYLLDAKVPDAQKRYFRALNLYQRILPENALVRELSGIYLDGGTLTRTQQALVDNELFAGSDVWALVVAFEALRGLDILAALGPQPGLDQAEIHALATRLQSELPDDDDCSFVHQKLKQFSPLIKPLSAQLVESWPPEDRVLTLP